MAHTWTGRGLVVGACLLTFLGAACTPTEPPPSPPTTSSAPTPAENAQEREERLAYEAAEKNYREFRTEFNNVLAKGGSSSATARMEASAGGDYLRELQDVTSAYKGLKHHATGTENIIYVRAAGYTPTELIMDICEDSRGVTTFDTNDKKLYTGDLRQLRLEFRLAAGRWKAWTGSGKEVKTCD